MILFDHEVARCLENDFFSLPDQLLARVLPHSARGGTAYDLALQEAQSVMTRHWSTERYASFAPERRTKPKLATGRLWLSSCRMENVA